MEVSSLVSEYLQALALIFIAEMGDKTQILSMVFATKFKIRQILIGVALGAAMNHGLAIAFGSLLSRYLPIDLLQLIAGFLFVFFAIWSLSAEEDDSEEVKSSYGPIVTVSLAFFLGELGDKTQLTALTLSVGSTYPLLVLAGTVSGMVLTSFLGILAGIKLGHRIKEVYLKTGAYAIFMFFGLQKIITSSLTVSWTILYWTPFLLLLSGVSYFRIRQFRYKLKTIERTAFQKRAEALRIFAGTLRTELDLLCKGQDYCRNCVGDACLVGYMKVILEHAKNNEAYNLTQLKEIEKLVDKSFDPDKAKGIMRMLNDFYASHPESFGNCDADVFANVREALERIVFGAALGHFDNFQTYKKTLELWDGSFGLKKL
jgi:putative Ca2+/H+ antiporter (TMEM165/GDT1 family)